MVSARGTARRTRADAEHERRGGMRYVWPWVLPLALLGFGWILHHFLGQRLPDAAFASAAVLGGGLYIAGMTWRYAAPRGEIIQRHAAGTALGGAFALDVLLIMGVTRELFWIVLLAGWFNAAAWNVRRLEVIRGEGRADGRSGLLGELGVSLASKKVVESSPERAHVRGRLGEGQTVEDLQNVAPAIGSHARTIRHGTTIVAGEHEGDFDMTMVFKDVLKVDIPWPGPYAPGHSVARGFQPGIYQTQRPVMIYPAGDYTRGIAPGHFASGGAPRTGKGVTSKILIADTSTRVDGWIMLGDTRKGDQFLAPIRDAVGWYKDTQNGVRAQMAALDRATLARNRALGAAGFESWTPQAALPPEQGGIGMPAIFAFWEEFANYSNENVTRVVNIGEACLSAGIFMFCSAQRWSADRVPTSFRSSVANSMCWGMLDEVSAGMILSDATLKAGPDPYEWKTRFPGRFLCEAAGVDPGLFPTTAKGYLAANDQLASVIAQHQIVTPLDEWTLEAFGDAYKGEPAQATVRVPSTIRPPAVDATEPAEAITSSEATDNEDEEEFMIPKHDNPEDQALADGINPRVPLAVVEGPDLSPQPEPGEVTLTPAQRDVAFAEILQGFKLRPITHPNVFTMQELVDAWAEKLGEFQASQRPHLTRRLNLLIDADALTRLRHGHYEIVGPISVTHVAPEEEDYEADSA